MGVISTPNGLIRQATQVRERPIDEQARRRLVTSIDVSFRIAHQIDLSNAATAALADDLRISLVDARRFDLKAQPALSGTLARNLFISFDTTLRLPRGRAMSPTIEQHRLALMRVLQVDESIDLDNPRNQVIARSADFQIHYPNAVESALSLASAVVNGGSDPLLKMRSWLFAIIYSCLVIGESVGNSRSERTPSRGAHIEGRSVFVVHGRNEILRRAMFDFLRSINLAPMEWTHAVELTGQGSPYIGEVLDAAFGNASAVVVLMTPDEVAYLRPEYSDEGDPDTRPATQPRPNVLFEAGMALGRDPKRTVLVEIGTIRPFSDVAGRHVVRLNNLVSSRQALAARLESAGCSVSLTGTDWHTTGDFRMPAPPRDSNGMEP